MPAERLNLGAALPLDAQAASSSWPLDAELVAEVSSRFPGHVPADGQSGQLLGDASGAIATLTRATPERLAAVQWMPAADGVQPGFSPPAAVSCHVFDGIDPGSGEALRWLGLSLSFEGLTVDVLTEPESVIARTLDRFPLYWADGGHSVMSVAADSLLMAGLDLSFVVAGWCPASTGPRLKVPVDAPWRHSPRADAFERLYRSTVLDGSAYYVGRSEDEAPDELLQQACIAPDEWTLVASEMLAAGADGSDVARTLLDRRATIYQVPAILHRCGVAPPDIEPMMKGARRWDKATRSRLEGAIASIDYWTELMFGPDH